MKCQFLKGGNLDSCDVEGQLYVNVLGPEALIQTILCDTHKKAIDGKSVFPPMIHLEPFSVLDELRQ